MPSRRIIQFSFAVSCRTLCIPWLLWALAAAGLTAASEAQPAPATSQARFTVVLDAAHGGDDSGGRINDVAGKPELEKVSTLAFGVRLRSLLAARGIPVVTTRESDATVDLNRRAEIANHANAQACISLHTSQTGSGIRLYVSSLPPSSPARFVPWETAQAAWVTRSLALAGVLNSGLLHSGLTVTLGRATLPAVDSMSCPAIAVELAPEFDLSHAAGHPQAASPDDPGYQARVAQALAAALLEWRTEGHQP